MAQCNVLDSWKEKVLSIEIGDSPFACKRILPTNKIPLYDFDICHLVFDI